MTQLCVVEGLVDPKGARGTSGCCRSGNPRNLFPVGRIERKKKHVDAARGGGDLPSIAALKGRGGPRKGRKG